MKALTEILENFEKDTKKKTQEAMKANLEVFLKEKYGIVLTDDDWQHVIHD